MIGEDFSHYRIESKLGEGGMGAVYKAYDKNLQRHAAIKVLPPALSADKTFVMRFLREARSIAKIRHPNLMHIYTVGEKNGIYYFAMEYIAGQTLGDIIRTVGRIKPAEAFRLIGQVMSALRKVHQAGIVHRDLKPGNIIIDKEDQAILMDFGLAKDRHEEGVTTAGIVLGTPEYMSPEQSMGQDVDARTDIYSLGMVLYEMLSGDTPFHAPSAIQILRMQCEEAPVRICDKYSDIPPEVGRIVHKAIAKDPAQRYASLTEMAVDMAAIVPTHALVEMAKIHAGFDSASVTSTSPATSPVGTAKTMNFPRTVKQSVPASDPTARTLKLNERELAAQMTGRQVTPAKSRWWLWVIGGALAGFVAVGAFYISRPRELHEDGAGDIVGKLPKDLKILHEPQEVDEWQDGEFRILEQPKDPEVTIFFHDNAKKTGRMVRMDAESIFLSGRQGKIEKISLEKVTRLNFTKP